MKKTRIFHGFLAAAAAVSLILILLLSAFEMAAYGDFGFYEKEYEKYEIQNTLPMEMDDIMDVTKNDGVLKGRPGGAFCDDHHWWRASGLL